MEDDINKIDDKDDMMYEDYLYDDRSGCQTWFIIAFIIVTIYMIIKLFNTEHL